MVKMFPISYRYPTKLISTDEAQVRGITFLLYLSNFLAIEAINESTHFKYDDTFMVRNKKLCNINVYSYL